MLEGGAQGGQLTHSALLHACCRDGTAKVSDVGMAKASGRLTA